eukprot:SAG31_NODE_98_length_25640_cov_9.936744_21_plen_60_part_00
MDADKLKEVMAELRGDFSSVKDPRRRKALEKLKKSGMQISGTRNFERAILATSGPGHLT